MARTKKLRRMAIGVDTRSRIDAAMRKTVEASDTPSSLEYGFGLDRSVEKQLTTSNPILAQPLALRTSCNVAAATS